MTFGAGSGRGPSTNVWVRVVDGHIVDMWSEPEPRTPRQQARHYAAAPARWSAIVDLMLEGMRETGNGKVVPEDA